jgi:hypothetical protein
MYNKYSRLTEIHRQHGANVVPKVVIWSKFVVDHALPLSSTSTFTPPSKYLKGHILVRANGRKNSFALG